MDLTDRTCEAFTAKGERCRRKAVTWHETPGDLVVLCHTHAKMITKRVRQGSDEEHVRRWRHLLGS